MRIRATKPEFWRSARIASVSWDARLVFKGIEHYVDDNGVGKDDVALIVGDVFPRDMLANPRETVARVSEALSELNRAGLLWRYTVDGTDLLYVAFWEQAQRIDKPGKGRLPRPDGTMDYKQSEIRESVASPRESVVPGTGEQGNRGTGDKETCAPQAEHETAPELPLPKKPHRRPYGDDAFDAFWEAYPRKDDPKKAWSCWQTAIKTADAADIIAGAERYRDDPNRSDEFTKLATSWLNAGSWANGPLPFRGGNNVVAIRPKQAAHEELFADAFARAQAREAGRS